MFAALKRKAQAPVQSTDLTEGLQRALRNPAREEGVAGDGAREPIRQALSALDAALARLEEAGSLVRQAARPVIEAASETDPGQRALLAERFDDVRQKIDTLLTEEDEPARPLLLAGAGRLTVQLAGASYIISPFPLSTAESGLDLPPPAEAFATHTEIADTLRRVETALERVARAMEVYSEDEAFLRTRLGG